MKITAKFLPLKINEYWLDASLELNGPVSSVSFKKEVRKPMIGPVETRVELHGYLKFNHKGQFIYGESFDHWQRFSNRTDTSEFYGYFNEKSFYNEKGNISRVNYSKILHGNEKNKTEINYILNYDSIRRLKYDSLSIIENNQIKALISHSLSYGSTGLMTDMIEKNNYPHLDIEIEKHHKMSYQDNLPILSYRLYGENRIVEDTMWIYDENHQVQTEVIFDSYNSFYKHGEPVTVKNEYYNGLLAKSTSIAINEEIELGYKYFAYDSLAQLLYTCTDENDITWFHEEKLCWNQYGDNVSRTKIRYHSDTIFDRIVNECFYEYDKYNNWIKRTTISDGRLQSIYTREIEYYESKYFRKLRRNKVLNN